MKYEYHSTGVLGTDLQAKGEEGWHLVGVNHEHMFWQRPVDDTVTEPELEVEAVAEPEAAVTAEPQPVETAPVPRRRGRRPKVRV